MKFQTVVSVPNAPSIQQDDVQTSGESQGQALARHLMNTVALIEGEGIENVASVMTTLTP